MSDMIAAIDFIEKRKKFNKELSAHIYISEVENRILIVADYHVKNVGCSYEQENVKLIPFNTKFDTIGRLLKEALLEFDTAEIIIKEKKATDWPAFKASGVKTVKRFQEIYTHLDMITNHQCCYIDIFARPSHLWNDGITVKTTISPGISPGPSDYELGKRMMKVYSACKLLDKNEY